MRASSFTALPFPPAQPALWVKVVSEAPSVVLDCDYGLLECTFPADVRAFKDAVIASRRAELECFGVTSAKLRVFYMGGVRPAAAAERSAMTIEDASLAPNHVLAELLASSDAFFLVTAWLPAGAPLCVHAGSDSGCAAAAVKTSAAGVAPAGVAGGAASPRSSGGGTPRGPARESRNKAAAAALPGLRYAFGRALASGATFSIDTVPVVSSSLTPALRDSLFAHRPLHGSLGGSFADFDTEMDGTRVVLLPATSGSKKGLPLFVVLSNELDVLAAAHRYRGAMAPGCVSYPLSSLPDSLLLTIDGVLALSHDSQPIILHASLTPVARMAFSDFATVLEYWGAQMCHIVAAAECFDDVFSEHSAPYVTRKLQEFAAAEQAVLLEAQRHGLGT